MCASRGVNFYVEAAPVPRITLNDLALDCGRGGTNRVPHATLVVSDERAGVLLNVTRIYRADHSQRLLQRALLLCVLRSLCEGGRLQLAALLCLLDYFDFLSDLDDLLPFQLFGRAVHVIAAGAGLGVVNVGDEGAIDRVDLLKIHILALDHVLQTEGKVAGLHIRDEQVSEGRVLSMIFQE